MKAKALPSFWRRYNKLPVEIQELARALLLVGTSGNCFFHVGRVTDAAILLTILPREVTAAYNRQAVTGGALVA